MQQRGAWNNLMQPAGAHQPHVQFRAVWRFQSLSQLLSQHNTQQKGQTSKEFTSGFQHSLCSFRCLLDLVAEARSLFSPHYCPTISAIAAEWKVDQGWNRCPASVAVITASSWKPINFAALLWRIVRFGSVIFHDEKCSLVLCHEINSGFVERCKVRLRRTKNKQTKNKQTNTTKPQVRLPTHSSP